MSYEISSSVANGTFSLQTVTASFSGTFERGMSISPDGTMAASNAYRHGASDPGSTDYGINIYMSSSGTGWAFDHSIDAGSYLPIALKWRTNSELWGIQNNRMSNWVSSSSGWSAGSVYDAALGTGGKSMWRFNPPKDMLALWKGGASAPVLIYSGSAGGTSWSSSDVRSITISGITNDAEGFAWAGDVDFIVGDHTYNSNRGRVVAMRSSDNGGSWSYNTGELMNGASSTSSGKHQLGIWLWYHTGSNTLLVQGAGNHAQHSYNRIWYWQSSSAEGYIPASDNSLVELFRETSPLLNRFTMHQEGDGDKILTIESYDGSYPDQQTYVIETGSSGWTLTSVGTPVRNLGSEGQIGFGPSSTGAVISIPGDNGDGSNPAVNRFFTMVQSDPSIATSVSQTVGTSGGTVQAGGTESSPKLTVSIPANSLSGDTTIGVDVAGTANPATSGIARLGIKGVPAYPVISLTPHGTTFSKPVTLTFDLEGDFAGSCPTDLKIFKRDDLNTKDWYELSKQHNWQCSGGTITLKVTSFSEINILGGTKMARTILNNAQLAKLLTAKKVHGRAVEILEAAPLTGSFNSEYYFLVQTGSGTPTHIRAQQMSAFFAGSGTDLTESSDTGDHRIIFANPGSGDVSGASLEVDATSLTFNPATNTFKAVTASLGVLTASSDARIEGNITSDGGNSQTIFGNTNGPGQSITLGGGSKVIAAGDLQVNGTAIDVDSASALTIGATVGANDLTLGANTSTVVIPGNLQVDGSQVIINTTVLEIEDKTILIASGSANAAAADGAGIVVEDIAGVDKSITFQNTGTNFKSSENFDVASGKVYKIANTEVLSATALTIGSAAMSEADLEKLDDITNGTVAASKAIVVDANRDFLNLNKAGVAEVSGSANLQLRAGKTDDVLVGDHDSTGDVVLYAKGGTIGNNNGFILSGSDDKALVTVRGGGMNSQKLQIEAGGSIGTIKYDQSLDVIGANGATVQANGGNATLKYQAGSALNISSTGNPAFELQSGNSTGILGRTVDISHNFETLGKIRAYKNTGDATDHQFEISSTATGMVSISASAAPLKLSGSEGLILEGTDEAAAVVGDKMYFLDSDGKVKVDAVSDVLGLAAGDGLTATAGVLAVDPVEKIFYSASSNTGAASGMSTDLLTASLNVGSDGNILSDSLQVFLNGMLQTLSSSTGVSAGNGLGIFDFRVSSSAQGFDATMAQAEAVVLEGALDTDDVLVVRYLKK